MFSARNIERHAALIKLAEEKVALSPQAQKLLLAGGGGALAAGIPTYMLTHALDEHKRTQTRDRAFGAGLATGVSAPHILRGLLGSMQPQPEAPQAPQAAQAQQMLQAPQSVLA